MIHSAGWRVCARTLWIVVSRYFSSSRTGVMIRYFRLVKCVKVVVGKQRVTCRAHEAVTGSLGREHNDVEWLDKLHYSDLQTGGAKKFAAVVLVKDMVMQTAVFYIAQGPLAKLFW